MPMDPQLPTSASWRVREIWRYPVKSMPGERLQSAEATQSGLAGDRLWALLDRETGKLWTARRSPVLLSFGAWVDRETGDTVISFPDGSRCRASEAETAAAVSRLLGKELVLVKRGERDQESFFDDSPLHLAGVEELARLSRHYPKGDFAPRRFRPNLVIEPAQLESSNRVRSSGRASVHEVVAAESGIGDPDADETNMRDRLNRPSFDASLTGRRIRVGGTTLLISAPCSRCVMTTLAQEYHGLPSDPDILKTIARYNDNNLGIYASVLEPGLISVGDPVTLLSH